MTTEFRWVETPEQLSELASALAGAPSHALDTESNSGFAYRERLCLLQFNVGGDLWLVDLLALGDQTDRPDRTDRSDALEVLRPALERPEPRTWLHGGEFDVACLKRDYDIALGGVWDTQQATTFLGWEKTGYGSVVEKLCGVALDKAFSMYDWGSRPIEPAALEYALDDVRYLLEAATELLETVKAADLEEEVEIANRAVMETTWNGGFRPDGLWRVKGVRTLDREAIPVCAALYYWREEVARTMDHPPGRVLNNRVLLSLAANQPRRKEQLRRLGVRGSLLHERGIELLEVIREARRNSPEVPSAPKGQPLTPRQKSREAALKRWRQKEAERRQVPPRVVLPARALEHLRTHGTDDLPSVPQLGPKRIRLYGDELARLCR